jgi:hypothetical protein
VTRTGRQRSAWATLGAAGLALIVAGCAEPTTGRVFGVVKVDGQPAKEGAISFFPVDGRGTTAGGAIVDGQYSVEAALGEVNVEIRVPKVVGEEKLYDVENSRVRRLMAETLPAKYNDQTELRFDVKPGENPKDWELETE